ncbi:hypothetical protein CI109_100741 [Kwoniella shandongensis]|uniref:NmrA-like domain-containing protein n=1 Tax=Kwoniella shandongensis TaxID=1734106 RepID=A0A5M6BMZ5_9TREE|nr:uncharacterized protein CI109_007421 [Kwoniella shandongensis]KAA5524244.1 hypothetical protein CI109_007421 [Kwoniella shandongensis]
MPKFLVAGATGKQGGATVKALVEHNAKSTTTTPVEIFGITRDPSSDKALAVAALPNVTLVKGNLSSVEDITAIYEKYGPFDGAFSIQETFIPDEVEQGSTFADLAVKYGVKRFVYTGGDLSGLSPSPLPFFETKRQIELHIHTLPLGWTIIRPPAFYENFFVNMGYDWGKGVYSVLSDETPLKQISSADIGQIAASILLEESTKHFKQTYSIAGSDVTKKQAYEALAAKGIEFEKDEDAANNIPGPLLFVFQFMNDHPWEASVEETKKNFPFVRSISEWLETDYKASA